MQIKYYIPCACTCISKYSTQKAQPPAVAVTQQLPPSGLALRYLWCLSLMLANPPRAGLANCGRYHRERMLKFHNDSTLLSGTRGICFTTHTCTHTHTHTHTHIHTHIRSAIHACTHTHTHTTTLTTHTYYP